MYRLVAYDLRPQYGAYNANPREVFRGPRVLCERYSQKLRKLGRLGIANTKALYFVRHVRGTGRTEAR